MKIIMKIYYFIIEGKLPTLAAALSFFVVLNSGSFLFLFVSMLSFLPVQIKSFIDEYMLDGLFKSTLLYFITTQENIKLTLLLAITSIYSSSSLYYHFLNISEILTRNPIKSKRTKALISVPITLFLIYFLVGILSILLSKYIIATILFILLIVFLSIYLINHNIFKKPIKRLFGGIIFTFLFIFLFTFFFILFIYIFKSFKQIYGLLSIYIIFMLYIYIVIIGLLIGIKLNCKNLGILYFLK